MDLRQLRYFAKIVELSNMTAASTALHVSQSSLSHHISNLELHFGVKLLVREARGVQCTPAGGILYEHAKVILRQVELAEAAVNTHGLGLPESVTLGMPRSEAPLLAPQLLEILARVHPELTLTIVEDAPDALAASIAGQKMDVAILADVGHIGGSGYGGAGSGPGGNGNGGGGNPTFDALHVISEDMLLVGPGAAQDDTPMAVADFADLPFILPRAPSSIRNKVDHLCKGLSIPYRVVAEAASVGVALRCVKAGICWAILPWAAVASAEIEACGFHLRAIEGAPLKRDLYVCMSTNAITRPAANVVRTLLIEMMRRMVRTQEWQHARLALEPLPA
ncbi:MULTISPECIES: LysR substrate-binding domain-containing protein [unclassified Achromobacter]|uniref:LysR substrate-binding domain-containing protein n=1 Tax=unclassified Achromobacter TaxID=2626865 RepID=UPI001303B982|nr:MULTISPECIES: LysR substrate-binding domain-containing protein [unclassified Achromobacter]